MPGNSHKREPNDELGQRPAKPSACRLGSRLTKLADKPGFTEVIGFPVVFSTVL